MTTNAEKAVDKEIGARIRAARLMLGMSQEKLGDALGVTFQQVQKYEKGTNRVGGSRMVRIAEKLNQPVSYFFGPSNGEKFNVPDSLIKLAGTRQGLELAEAFASIRSVEMREAIVATAKAAVGARG